MLGCGCDIGCLTGAAFRVGKGLSGSAVGIEANAVETEVKLTGKAFRVGKGLYGYANLVCSVGAFRYFILDASRLDNEQYILG